MENHIFTRDDLFEIIMQATGCNKHRSKKAVKNIIDSIKEHVANGGEVQLRGFGCFNRVRYAGRKAYDIFRSENIDVPAQNRPKFRAYPNFVKRCNEE